MKRKWILIAGLLLLIIIIVYHLFNCNYKPQMTLAVTFTDAPPIVQNFFRGTITAYYRGYKVGKICKVALSEDQKLVIFYLKIDYKNLKLPKNVEIILRTEDVFGARYISVNYPEHPSSEYLSDGDVIKGFASYERIDKFLVTELKTGKLKKLIDNLINLTTVLDKALTTGNTEFASEIKKSGADVGIIINNLKEIISDPQVKRDIKSTIHYSSKSMKSLNSIMESNSNNISQTLSNAPESIDKTIKNLESINKNMPDINNSILSTNDTIINTGKTINRTDLLLSTTNCHLDDINKKVPAIPANLLYKADNALTKFDCIGTEVIELLNERFLIFKFMFGNPGSSFERCKRQYPDCLCIPEK
jgi:ABC-type transporter Mla subunit MlaD